MNCIGIYFVFSDARVTSYISAGIGVKIYSVLFVRINNIVINAITLDTGVVVIIGPGVEIDSVLGVRMNRVGMDFVV
jgi:hypothetical protein